MRFNADQNWLIKSPELLKLDSELSAASLIAGLEANSKFKFEKTHRLGVYFEQLWNHLVSTGNDLELVAQNLQVIIDKHTFGEFDSIIKQNDKTIHCELAVKFYLQIGSGDKLSDWVGPNLKDRFDDKHQRLFAHQLALSDKPEIMQWLKEKAISIDGKRLLTKGRLFYPYQDFIQKNFNFPQEVNPGHSKGFWISYIELDSLLSSTDYHWYQLPRFYWLAEIEQIDEQLLSVETSFTGFSLQKIVALEEGQEVMRGFVVNDDWLHKAKQRIKI